MIKKTIKIIVLILCLKLNSVAQKTQVAADVKDIQIGQKMPDVVLNNIHNYKTKTARVSEFKGKLLILDFWATWCSPCIAMLPKMEALQEQFEGKVQFLSVAYQSAKVVLPFLEKQRKGKASRIPEIVEDKVLRNLFPHTVLPHYVWIGPDGVVKAITEDIDVNATTINSMLNGSPMNLAVKRDEERIPYDKDKPLLVNNNGGDGSNLIFHSVLTGYTAGMGSGFSYYTNGYSGGQQITSRNQNIKLLYRLAYSDRDTYFGDNRMAIEVKDPSRVTSDKIGKAFEEWMKQGNAFCYELIVPPALAKDAFKIMRDDLDRYFSQYEVFIEKRKRECLVLVRTSEVDKLKSTGGTPDFRLNQFDAKLQNVSLERFIAALDRYYMQNSAYPVFDETNYKGKVDLNINAGLASYEVMNQELKKYDLKFIVAERETEVLVIKDRVR